MELEFPILPPKHFFAAALRVRVKPSRNGTEEAFVSIGAQGIERPNRQARLEECQWRSGEVFTEGQEVMTAICSAAADVAEYHRIHSSIGGFFRVQDVLIVMAKAAKEDQRLFCLDRLLNAFRFDSFILSTARPMADSKAG